MKTIKASVQVSDEHIPVEIEAFERTTEAVKKLGEDKALSLLNYGFALFQRAEKRSEIVAFQKTKKKTLRGRK